MIGASYDSSQQSMCGHRVLYRMTPRLNMVLKNNGKLHEERNWKSLFLKYKIYADRLRIQSTIPLYWYDIPYDNIETVEISSPIVIWDIIKHWKRYFRRKYGYGIRIIKNDLADLSRHIIIEKKNGFWKQIRITPRNPEKFQRILEEAIRGNL